MAQPPANALDALLPQAPPPQNHRETERLRLELTRLLQEESAPASGPTAAPPTQPDTPSVLRAAQTPALSASLPALSELPPAVRQELGALKMNAHLYSQVPAERVVVINMQRYREGDRLGSGPRVEAITPRGAVLSLASRRFRIDVR